MRLASIDLGTNTCNLSIAEWSPQKIDILFSDKKPIKLGAEGFPEGNIAPPAIKRLVQALLDYKCIIEKYKVADTQVFATSGLRNASNQQEILSLVEEKTGFAIQVISGDEEAEYIYRGVRQAVPMDEKPCVLLDIGGGSIEIQIVSMGEVFWRKSFDLGIARLLLKFKPADPLTSQNIDKINAFLDEELEELKELAEKYRPELLIGSSGSFDTFASLYIHNANLMETYSETEWFQIPIQEWQVIYHQIIESNRTERLNMAGMEAMRVEMIPLASVFTEFLINLFPIQELIRSAFALKEGVFYLMAGNLLKDH